MSSHAARALPSDAALRREVLDPGVSWMLQAPAGSGKTELLMQRFLSCLATVEQPESVLAITFTRKAAAEMRNRILSALQRANVLSDSEFANCAPHEQQSLSLARDVLSNSAALGWNILEFPTRLQVRTLDSFCESIVQRAPCKGLLGGAAAVTEDAQPLYAMAAQRVIDELAIPGVHGDAVAALLTHLDNNVRGARGLLAAMLAQRDQWLHFLGRSDTFDPAQQQNLRARLESALALAVEEDLSLIRTRVKGALSGEQATELFALLRYASAQIANASEPLVESIAASAEVISISPESTTPRMALQYSSGWPEAVADELPSWRAISDFLLTSEGALRKSVNKNNGFPTGGVRETELKKRCVDLLSALAQLPGAAEVRAALERIRRLPNPRYTETQWEFMQAVLELLPRAAAHLQVIFAEQSVIDFAEYAQRALAAIGDAGDPTELGLQLGYRIRHILVDEFQDTNRVQVELLARLLATWEADEQCSTFCVGDPMQSIYAFRQADVAIFQQARTAGIGGHSHRFGKLSQNFRSQAKLVDWFNQVFPEILGEQSDLSNAVAYAPAEPSRPALDGPAVAFQGFAKGERSAEAKHLADSILCELAEPTAPDEKPSTIAVLVRSRTHLPELVEALRAAGISYRAVKTDRLAERALVRDLDALRKALTDLADRTAWLSVLRAPWCGLALADLLELCRGDERSTICGLVRQRVGQLSEHAQLALARCWPVLEAALQRGGRGSLRTLVESTWLQLGGAACLGGETTNMQARQALREQGVRDAEAYFALLEAQSSAGAVRDPATFSEKLHELFAPPDNRSGIRVEIMPIHQAKGLEWDVVFLPALERRSRQDDKSLLCWRLRRRDNQEFLLLGPMEAAGCTEKNSRNATIETFLRSLAGDCSREELKRLFYVAATRARKRLYLSAVVDPEHQPDANSILRLLWNLPGMQEQFAPSQAPQLQSTMPENQHSKAELLLRRLPASYTAPPLPQPLSWSSELPTPSVGEHRFEWVGDLLPRVGVVAHSFLQRIAVEGVSQWNASRVASSRPAIAAMLLRNGVAQAELEQGIARVVEALQRTLEDECGRWLLSPHEDHRCELAVSAIVNGELQHVRVDRTFIFEGVRWLIDYKITEQLGGDLHRFLSMQVEKYSPDMQRYVRVLRLWDARPLRCALYLPLLGQFCPVEVDAGIAQL